VTARPKTDTAPPLPQLVPIGYSVPAIRRRTSRPLHSRQAVLEAAEAVFKPKARESDKLHDIKPRLSRWPTCRTQLEKASLDDLIVANPEVLDV
jgi:hypothetical protein